MKRFAIIEDGKVKNVVMADAGFTGGVQSDTANINDSWDGINFIPPPQPQFLTLELILSGGDGRNDPIGVYNDGINSISVSGTVRKPDGSIVALSGSWRIILRHADGSEYETITVAITNGLLNFSYKTTNQKTGQVFVRNEDFTDKFNIGGIEYGIKAAGDTSFKISRSL